MAVVLSATAITQPGIGPIGGSAGVSYGAPGGGHPEGAEGIGTGEGD